MIWKCVDDEQLQDEASSMARHFAVQPTRGLALIKQALLASTANTLEDQLELEKDSMRAAGRTADYREGVAAFMEKRAPQFKGE